MHSFAIAHVIAVDAFVPSVVKHATTITHHLTLAAAVLILALSSSAAPPAANENVMEVKLGGITWQIRYVSKTQDGTLLQAKGRTMHVPEGIKTRAHLFSATKCTIGKDTLILSEGFVVSKANIETSSAGPQTRAILTSDGHFYSQGGAAHTRIVQR